MTELASSETDNIAPEKPDLLNSSVLISSYANSSLLFRLGDENSSPRSSFQPPPSNFGGLTNFGTPPVSQVNTFSDTERGMSMFKSISKNFKFDNITSTTPLKEVDRSSSRIRKKDQLPSSSPFFGNIGANLEDSPSSISGLLKPSRQEGFFKASVKSARSSRFGKDVAVEASADLMDLSCRYMRGFFEVSVINV